MVRPTTVKTQRSTQRKGGAHVKVENDFLHEEPAGLGKDATNRRRARYGELPAPSDDLAMALDDLIVRRASGLDRSDGYLPNVSSGRAANGWQIRRRA